MNNQIKKVEKLDWKTKKFTNRQLAELSIDALHNIFEYLNNEDIRFYNLKLEKTGEIEVTSTVKKYVWTQDLNKPGGFSYKTINPGEKYMVNKYDWIKSYTYSANQLDSEKAFSYKKVDSIEISSSHKFSVGWSCSSSIQYSIKISKWQLSNSYYIKEVIDNLELFIEKLPKQAKKKIFKIVYIYQKMDKNERCYQKIFSKFSNLFNLSLNTHGKKYNFSGFEKTISTIEIRNRRINNLLRKRKW